MTDLTYHLETENRNGKNQLCISIPTSPLTKQQLLSQAKSGSEREALALLFKGARTDLSHFDLPKEGTFDVLKLLGTTGRVFFRGKKVVIDPFSSLEMFLKAAHLSPGKAEFTAHFLMNGASFPLTECAFVFAADPSWVVHHGVIRKIKEEVCGKWVRLAASLQFVLEGTDLSSFLEEVEGDLRVEWQGEQSSVLVDPLPILILADRHGGFANLYFDYGIFGTCAPHDPLGASFRNLNAEKQWEKDLLETDFVKKCVGKSHFYCPLDKVAKSLTFLLEVGWSITDAKGRKVLRQKGIDFDAKMKEGSIAIEAKLHYGSHEMDLSRVVGAFNRREQFVELNPEAVALIDFDAFEEHWGDLDVSEITSEGIVLKKNQFGPLLSLMEGQGVFVKEGLKEKISRLCRGSPNAPIEPGKNFQGTLFPYQMQGLQWLKFLDEGGFGGLLADDMGLGKTVQVLAFFSQLALTQPCLIITPTSLVFNWEREMQRFLPSLCVYRHEGKERLRNPEGLSQKQVILTSYALLRIDAELFQTLNFQVVVLDEAQMIKNPDSQIARTCSNLKGGLRLAITGTPIENRLEDLFSIFHFLQPDLLGEKEVVAAHSNIHYFSKIKKKIRPFLLRRKKEQVCLDLPPKLEQVVFVEMGDSQRQIYERWLKNTRQGLLKKVSLDGAASHRMEILEAILRLRQLCAHPWLVEERSEEGPQEACAKLDRLMSDLEEIVGQKQKVLIYSQFTTMLRCIEAQIKQRGWGYVYLDGSTKNREEAVCQFQEDEKTSIFLISLKAGGVGLNLTAADYVFIYDPWWNEAAENQAIDRAHRLGKKSTVIARRYITALSIEEKIMHLKKHKLSLAKNILESEEGFVPASLDDLLALLE